MINDRQKVKLTVLIPAFNVEDILERAIKSASWADEVFVVDSFSSDKTVSIAEKMGARVVQHEYIYSAKQKNWAIPQAKNDWVLLLDSDEVITRELKEEIENLFRTGDVEKYDGFAVPRPHYFLGKWLKWGGRYPLYNIRLFRKSCRYEDRDVHAHIILSNEKVKKLKGDILHYSDPDLAHFFKKFNRYTTYQANYMMRLATGEKKVKLEARKIFSYFVYLKSFIKDFWYFLPFASVLRFLYMYFFRLGFLDGKQGFLIAVLYGFQDYVSKTKFLELLDKDPKFRRSTQIFIMRHLILSGKFGKYKKGNVDKSFFEKSLSLLKV